MNAPTPTARDVPFAHWALRIALASTFLYHGPGKFADLGGGAERFGLPVALYAAVALIESVAPLLILAGGFVAGPWGDRLTRLGAAMLIPIMLGAIATVHWGRWNFAPSETHPMGGMEFQTILILIMVYLVLRGRHA